MLGWNYFSSLMSLTLELNLGPNLESTSLRITGMVFLKEEGFGRAEGLAELQFWTKMLRKNNEKGKFYLKLYSSPH